MVTPPSAARSWTFGDGNTNTVDASPTHVYTTAGTKTVILTVRDDAGASDEFSKDVVVTAGPPGNVAPTAAFTYLCTSLDCSFANGSTDSDGNITTYAWEFGDGATSDLEDPAHTFAATATTPFNVKLTVTDDDGATNSVTQVVTVTPGAGLQCDNGSGVLVACTLLIEERSRVTVRMVSNACNARGNTLKVTFTTPAVVTQTLFTNGCREPLSPPAEPYRVRGNTPLDAGTELEAEFTSGSTEPDRVPPRTRVTGAFPTWTLEFDDGEDPSNPGEPDFNDIVLEVHAEAAP